MGFPNWGTVGPRLSRTHNPRVSGTLMLGGSPLTILKKLPTPYCCQHSGYPLDVSHVPANDLDTCSRRQIEPKR